MENLAIAVVTCDKYAHVWNDWYYAFTEHWDIRCPVYWLGETLESPDDDFIQIYHEAVEADQWTLKLRTQLEQIPEDNVFIWLDDLIIQKSINVEFDALYKWFVKNDADALRIMSRDSAARYDFMGTVSDRTLYKLKSNSPYRVSFSPNFYRKSFLLDILQVTESPWESELFGSKRVDPKKNIYAYHIDGWYINKIVQ